MSKELIKQVGEYQVLYRDTKTGIAFVENGSTGLVHSCHANIDATGSVRGMKKQGYWRSNARTIRCRGAIYNVDTLVVDDELDELARQHCRCGGKH